MKSSEADMGSAIPTLSDGWRGEVLTAANLLLDQRPIRRSEVDRLAASKELGRLATEAVLPCMPDPARVAALVRRLRNMEPDADGTELERRAAFVDRTMLALGAANARAALNKQGITQDILWLWALVVIWDERLTPPVTPSAPLAVLVGKPSNSDLLRRAVENQAVELERLRNILATAGHQGDTKTMGRLRSWAGRMDAPTIKAISADLWSRMEGRAIQVLSYVPLLLDTEAA